MNKPTQKPANPNFSSGPCAKRPGYSVEALKDAALGRSHRSKIGKAKLAEVIEKSKRILGIPEEYVLGILPGSDTGAFEAAMWTMLGERGVDMLAWESFGAGWVTDAKKQLKLSNLRVFDAGYGELPDLSQVDFSRDVCFTWNGTTSGVCVPNGHWIPDTREGLTLCDATSAVFAMNVPFEKLDVITWSWQKVMGGEGAHGMLALSPRAVERLKHYTPAWPLPKLFRLTKGGELIEGIFRGETINTPSLLCVEDALDGLNWAENIGGLQGLIARSQANFDAVAKWVEATPWVDFLASDPSTRSTTSICLKIVDPWYTGLSDEAKVAGAKQLASALDKEGVAYDIGAYRDAPPGLRIWGGATVETAYLEALFPWLDWAYGLVKEEKQAA